jgi:hypothetical protein
MGLRGLGLEFEGLLEMLRGFFEAAGPREKGAEAGMRLKRTLSARGLRG